MYMKSIRNFLFVLTGYLLRFALLGSISVLVVLGVLGNSKNVKKIMVDTKAYNRFVPAVIDANKSTKPSPDSIDYNNPVIYYVFVDSFPARDLQYNAEVFINSVYAWLDGSAKNISFRADFTRNKVQLASGLSKYAFDRLKALPPCKTVPESVNPLTITCRPVGYDSKEVQDSYEQLLLSSDSFLPKTVFTQNELPKSADGQTIEQKLHYAPTLFKWLHRSPYILGTLLLGLSVLYVSLNRRHRRALSSLGSILMGAGIGLVILPLLFDYVIPHYTRSLNFSVASTGTQKIFNDIFDKAYKQIDVLFITSGLIVASIGAVTYLFEKATRPKSKYINIAKRSGVATSIEKPKVLPKSLKGRLSNENIPLQSSDRPAKQDPKKVRENNKYRKLYSKKGL